MLSDWIAKETDYESAYFGKWHIGPVDDLYNSRFKHRQQPHPDRPAALNNSQWHPNNSLGPLVQSVGDGKDGTLDVPMEGFPDVVTTRFSQDFPTWPNRYDHFESKPHYQRKLRLFDDIKNPHTVGEADLQELLACCFSYLELIDGIGR